MASNSRLYTFTNDKTVNPTKLEVELNNLLMYWNNHEQGLIQHSTIWTASLRVGLTVKTSAGDYDVLSTDCVVVINKGTGAATTVTLPASPSAGRVLVVKDGKGDAASNNITVSGNGKNIDGAASVTIGTNYDVRRLVYNGTQWNLF